MGAIQAVMRDDEHKDNHHDDSDVDIHTLEAPECLAPMEEECNTILVYGNTPEENMFVNECCCLNHSDKEMLGCALFTLDADEQPAGPTNEQPFRINCLCTRKKPNCCYAPKIYQ